MKKKTRNIVFILSFAILSFAVEYKHRKNLKHGKEELFAISTDSIISVTLVECQMHRQNKIINSAIITDYNEKLKIKSLFRRAISMKSGYMKNRDRNGYFRFRTANHGDKYFGFVMKDDVGCLSLHSNILYGSSCGEYKIDSLGTLLQYYLRP